MSSYLRGDPKSAEIFSSLKHNPIWRKEFDEFVESIKFVLLHECPAGWSEDNLVGRRRYYDYEDLLKRDKLSIDLFWIKDASLTDTDSMPTPDGIAEEIVDNLKAALEQFTRIAVRLGKAHATPG